MTSQKTLKSTMESQAMLLADSNAFIKNEIYEDVTEPMPAKSSIHEREKWNNKLDFFFSGLGYAVGLSNVWRFPYLCYKNGGGAFLVAYAFGVFFGGIPMFFLEVGLGQYMSRGGPGTWNISPIFKGIGYASAVMAYLSNLFYIVLLAYSLYFLGMSFNTVLPWASCDNWWNTENCVTPFEHTLDHALDNKSIDTMKSSAEEFWQLNVLRITNSFDEIGGIRWELLVCLALSWVAIYFCIFKGIKWTGKIVYFTSTFPFVLLAIIMVRGLTLDGAMDGIKYLFIPKWYRLKSSEVWIEAITQAFYSYGVGLGAVTTLGSYNKFKKDCYKECLILAAFSEATCLISGLVIFSVLGYMAKITGKDISDVADGGPGLAFVAYPSALSQLPFAPFWSVLFFLMLIFVALDGQFVCVEGFVTACTDEWPRLRKRRMSFLFVTCFVSFLIGIIFVTEGGVYWFEIFNTYACAGWAMLAIMFFECAAVAYGYGVNRFYENIQEMIGYYPGRFWKYCWAIFTPGMCILVFAFSVIQLQPFKYKDYVYPWYGEMMGLMLAFSSIGCVPLYAIYKFLTNFGNIKNIIRP